MHPFRLSLKNKTPVTLLIEIENDSDKPIMLSYEVLLGNSIAFSKQGLTNAMSKKFDKFAPGAKDRQYYEIYAKPTARTGIEEPVVITLMEHYNGSYNYILGKKTKNLSVLIE